MGSALYKYNMDLCPSFLTECVCKRGWYKELITDHLTVSNEGIRYNVSE